MIIYEAKRIDKIKAMIVPKVDFNDMTNLNSNVDSIKNISK